MNFENSRSFAKMMDHNDPLKSYREKFYYPKNENNKKHTCFDYRIFEERTLCV